MSSATFAGIKPPRNAQVPGIAANSYLLLERVRALFYSRQPLESALGPQHAH